MRAVLVMVVAASLSWPVAARAESPSIAVVDARGVGMPAQSLAAVTSQLYATAARLGYRMTPETTTAELAARIGPGGPTPADLLAVAIGARADHAVGATLSSENGHYAVTFIVANADRTGPFLERGEADATTLEATVARLVRSLLLPVSFAPTPAPSQIPLPSRPPRSRIAIQTEGAFGVSEHPFYNQLLGARYDYGFTDDVALGGYLGYANLKGKDGRTGNVLGYAQLEYRLHGSGDSGFRIPLRFGSGYLPKNGPFLRLAAGLSFPIGDSSHLEFDLLAPTFWIVKDRTVVSMDVAAEVAFDL